MIEDDLSYDLAGGGLEASRAQSLSLRNRCRGLLNRWPICRLGNGEGALERRPHFGLAHFQRTGHMRKNKSRADAENERDSRAGERQPRFTKRLT